MKLIAEEVLEIKKKASAKNYFIFNDLENIKKSYLIKNNRVLLINNFDLDEMFIISKYKTVNLHNLFIFQKDDTRNIERIKIDMEYLIEIASIRNYFVIFGFSQNLGLCVNLYSESNLTFKYSTNIPLQPIDNSQQLLLDNIRINFANDNFNPIKKTFLYNYCKVNDESLMLVIPNSEFVDISIKADKLVKNQYYLSDDLKKKKVNCVNFDKFKFVVSFDDGTIKVFSAKEKNLWYNLLSGSMTVIPKSFVAHPDIVGFSKIYLTKYSIIGAMGNLIREYSFNQNFNTIK